MKEINSMISAAIAAFVLSVFFLSGNELRAQTTAGALKVGVYDSRVVVFAWSRSENFNQYLRTLNQQSDSAKKVNDTAKFRELSVQAMSFQHLLHQTVFSNGSIGFVMAIIKDRLPEVAKTAGVSVILSKWELNYSDPSVEIVDLTSQITLLFQPKQNIDQMVSEISKTDPLPLDQMGIEMDMLDGYCKKFGKK